MRKYITFAIAMSLIFGLTVKCTVAKATECKDDRQCSMGYHSFQDSYLSTSDGKLHGKRYVYISKKFQNQSSKGLIAAGFTNWNISGNEKVRLAETSDFDNCQIYIVPENLGGDVNGITYYRRRAGNKLTSDVDNLGENYIYSRIEINEKLCQSRGILTKVTTHECGHALGLSHVTCRESIMYPASGSKKMLDTPSNLDKATMCHVYGASYSYK